MSSQSKKISTPDGVEISAHEWGNPKGAEVVFVHGISQSHLSWWKQFSDQQLLSALRLIAYDVRGHGSSSKPPEAAYYFDSKRYGDEVAAIIGGFGLKRPLLVGWSFGGGIVADYLRHHGGASIAAINFVAPTLKWNPEFLGELNFPDLDKMSGEDLAANIEGTKSFIRNCFEKLPAPDVLETALGYNMVVPPQIRGGLLARERVDNDPILASLKIPVLFSHGNADKLILYGMSVYASKLIANAKLSTYHDIGHAPFVEDTARFNRELLDLALAVGSGRPAW